MTAWDCRLRVFRALLAALLVGVGFASGPVVERPLIEYSRGQAQGPGFLAPGVIVGPRQTSHGAATIASARVAAVLVVNDHGPPLAVDQTLYSFTTPSHVPGVLSHAYEAIGPPATDISQPA